MGGAQHQNASRERSSAPTPRGGTAQVQAKAACTAPQLVLHGRQVPRLLQDHHRFQSRPDRRLVRRMLHCLVSTHRWKGEAYRRMLLQKEATLNKLDRRFDLVKRVDRCTRPDMLENINYVK